MIISDTGGLVDMKLICGTRIAGTSRRIRKEDKVNIHYYINSFKTRTGAFASINTYTELTDLIV